MFPILLAVGIVSGLVVIATKVNPKIRPTVEQEKLTLLKARRDDELTLDNAEDGRVLARKFGDEAAAKRFDSLAVLRRKQRGRV